MLGSEAATREGIMGRKLVRILLVIVALPTMALSYLLPNGAVRIVT